MQHRILPFALLGVAGVALAAGTWKDFAPAFPGLPCMDGWASCLVSGTGVTPGMVLDGAQRPQPANLRVGFFDLQPLPSFSPFGGLSAYTGELGGSKPAEVAAAEPAAPEPEPTAPEPAAPEPAAPEPAAPEPVATAPERTTRTAPPESAPVRSSPTPEPRPAAVTTTAPEATPTRSKPPLSVPVATTSTTPAPTTAPTAVQIASTSRSTPPPATQPAPTTTPTPPGMTRTAAQPTTATTTPTPAAAPASTPAVAELTAPKDDGSCDNLVALEAPAMMGQLGDARRRCLESRMNTESAQTNKGKISRVLMADAEARGDKADWDRLIKNHLENLDRSDPNLCFKYAIYLSRGGSGKASQVIRWADYAMENKSQWVGATYTKNVYALYKLKAQAANLLWQDAEAGFVATRSDENQAKAEKYRGMTKNYSLEWLDYARASGQDTKAPMTICVSSAGNKEFCEG